MKVERYKMIYLKEINEIIEKKIDFFIIHFKEIQRRNKK